MYCLYLSWHYLSWLDISWLDLSWLDLSWLDLSRLDLSWLNFSLLDPPDWTCPGKTYPDLTYHDLTYPELTSIDLTIPDLTCPDGTCPEVKTKYQLSRLHRTLILHKVAGWSHLSNNATLRPNVQVRTWKTSSWLPSWAECGNKKKESPQQDLPEGNVLQT